MFVKRILENGSHQKLRLKNRMWHGVQDYVFICVSMVPPRFFRYVLHDKREENRHKEKPANNQSFEVHTYKTVLLGVLNTQPFSVLYSATLDILFKPRNSVHPSPLVPTPDLADAHYKILSRVLARKSTCVTTTRRRASTLADQRRRSSTSERTQNASGMAAGWKSQRYVHFFGFVCYSAPGWLS